MISQTVEYALRAMTYLAGLEPGATASSAVIAQSTRVPQGYLSKVLRDLVVAELISSQRGPNGGFSLARAPGLIYVLEIVSAVDPIPRIRRCPLGNPQHKALCPLHRRLDDALAEIESGFSKTSLTDLVDSNSRAKQCQHLTPGSADSTRSDAAKK